MSEREGLFLDRILNYYGEKEVIDIYTKKNNENYKEWMETFSIDSGAILQDIPKRLNENNIIEINKNKKRLGIPVSWKSLTVIERLELFDGYINDNNVTDKDILEIREKLLKKNQCTSFIKYNQETKSINNIINKSPPSRIDPTKLNDLILKKIKTNKDPEKLKTQIIKEMSSRPNKKELKMINEHVNNILRLKNAKGFFKTSPEASV